MINIPGGERFALPRAAADGTPWVVGIAVVYGGVCRGKKRALGTLQYLGQWQRPRAALV